VDYYKDCAETQPYTTKTFENQIGIGGTHFTDSGDSGALVLDASNAQRWGFIRRRHGWGWQRAERGESIGDVLHELSTETGSPLSLVGTNTAHSIACLRYDPAVPTELRMWGLRRWIGRRRLPRARRILCAAMGFGNGGGA